MITIKKLKGLILSTLLFLSIGTVAANIDSVGLLSAWYSNAFKQEADHIEGITSKRIDSEMMTLEEFTKDTTLDTENNLAHFGNSTWTQAQNEIKSYKAHYVNRIVEAKSELANKANYGEYKNQRQKQLEAEIDEEVTSILPELLSN